MLEPIINLLKSSQTAIIEVKIIANSSQQSIVQLTEKSPQQFFIKIKLKSVPEKGKANQELVKLLSESLNLPSNHFEIISGQTNPHKLIRIHALQ
jgi:uncharacterized protein (TIGR00251 family)